MRNAEYVRARLRIAVSAAGGQRALARKIGCSVQFLNAILQGNRPPAGKPLEYLGLRKRVTYESV